MPGSARRRTTAGVAAAYPGQVPGLYAWLRRNPRLVDGALACRPRRISLRGLAICLAGAVVATWRWHPVHPVDGMYTVGVETALFGGPVLLAWLLGDSARWRRGYYQALEEKAARLERERDAQALVAAAAERARIARDIHDVVAHNVSVMVVQADGAAFALDASPQRAADALAAISATGRRALARCGRPEGPGPGRGPGLRERPGEGAGCRWTWPVDGRSRTGGTRSSAASAWRAGSGTGPASCPAASSSGSPARGR
jgi:hypothetical protein